MDSRLALKKLIFLKPSCFEKCMLEKSELAALRQLIFLRINLSISGFEKYSFFELNVGLEPM